MTKEVLNKLSGIHYEYLNRIREDMRKVNTENYDTKTKESFINQCKSTARGYIKCLVNCGIISDNEFRIIYTWFTI